VGAFYLLLTHEVRNESGEHVVAFRAILDYLPKIQADTFWTFVVIGTLVRSIGILASMVRWYLLLVGQGIRLPFIHLAGSFLIGRFIGTFLPSTIGLDGYKLYDAARFSGRTVEATAATVVEKVFGVVGMFLCFLLTFPLGYDVLGDRATLVAAVTVPLAIGVVGGFLLLLLRPALFQALLRNLPIPGRARVAGILDRVMQAATAYRGQGALLSQVCGLSFLVHFCTAAMYYFTAIAIGAAHANFWEVTFASTIQIFATVISPFTIAGEGVREIVQALLLANKIGTSASILSAALGFWAAEALTLGGGIIYMMRGADYRPAFVEVKERSED
jgi:glycosyltransferase 2 family protein